MEDESSHRNAQLTALRARFQELERRLPYGGDPTAWKERVLALAAEAGQLAGYGETEGAARAWLEALERKGVVQQRLLRSVFSLSPSYYPNPDADDVNYQTLRTALLASVELCTRLLEWEASAARDRPQTPAREGRVDGPLPGPRQAGPQITPPSTPTPRPSAPPPPAPPVIPSLISADERKAAVAAFVSRVNQVDPDQPVTKRDLSRVAPYKSRKQFQDWQKGAGSKAAHQRFSEILEMEPEDFLAALKKKRSS